MAARRIQLARQEARAGSWAAIQRRIKLYARSLSSSAASLASNEAEEILPMPKPVLQFGDQRLDAGAVVVDASKVVDVAVEVVGDEELDGEVEALPQEDLAPAVALVGPEGEHAIAPRWPVFALKFVSVQRTAS
jgi:hypothetical protein